MKYFKDKEQLIWILFLGTIWIVIFIMAALSKAQDTLKLNIVDTKDYYKHIQTTYDGSIDTSSFKIISVKSNRFMINEVTYKDTLLNSNRLHYWLNKPDTLIPVLALKSALPTFNPVFNPNILRTKYTNYGLKLNNRICFKEFFITDPTMTIRLGWRFDGKIIWRELKNE
jgi:hypothetical protein